MTNPLVERLHHHVTGAIERGEAAPIVEQPNERETILNALQAFIRQRPGMDPRNYDYAGYQTERRQVHRDLQHAEKLLGAVRWRDGITAETLKSALKGAFSGRLSWSNAWRCPGCGHVKLDTYENNRDKSHCFQCAVLPQKAGKALDYCAGQYFPTEYRKAVCAVLASALWDYWRLGLPEPSYEQHGDAENLPMQTKAVYGPNKLSAGAFIRKSARKEFGLEIAKRYFDYRASDYR